MRNAPLFLLILIFLFSCQKELGLPGVLSDTPVGRLLIKVTGTAGDSVITTDYEYDAADRISSQQVTRTIKKNTTINFKRYYRDISGRITSIAELITHNLSASDTVYTYVYYPDAATTHFSYTTSRMGIMGTTVEDSTVFTYSGDKVLSFVTYLRDSLQSVSIINNKWEYDYDNNNNVILKKSFTYSRGTFVPLASYKFSYDSTVNPLPGGIEAILLKLEANGSRNNISSIETTDLINSANNTRITRTYSLNKSGKPEKGYEKLASDSSYTYSYIYK